jgi:outer membrane protein TolC
MVVAQNLEVKYSRLSLDVSRRLEGAEQSLYEPIFFGNLRREGRERQRSIDEMQTYASGKSLLEETASTTELGVRGKLPTGAELSLSYKTTQKANNLIPQYSFGFLDTEHNGLLSLTVRQPLLRNAGRSVIETDLRIAELEQQIATAQLVQQTQKVSIDGLNLYWQLHKAQQSVHMRQEAVTTSATLLADAQSRVVAGKTPASAIAELRGAVLGRKADLLRSEQALQEARSKLMTTINLIWQPQTQIATQPTNVNKKRTSLEDRPAEIETALGTWSPYVIALLRQQQAQIRLNFASNQKKPNLELLMGYSATGLAYTRDQAEQTTLGGRYPEWYVGLNLELPAKGNQRAAQQFQAQVARTEQAALELQAIRNSFVNDLNLRLADVKSAHEAVVLGESDLKLREEIFANEQQRVKLGSGSVGNLIQKQSEWLEARQRLLENQVRVEIASSLLQYTEGKLLAEHGILIDEIKQISN